MPKKVRKRLHFPKGGSRRPAKKPRNDDEPGFPVTAEDSFSTDTSCATVDEEMPPENAAGQPQAELPAAVHEEILHIAATPSQDDMRPTPTMPAVPPRERRAVPDNETSVQRRLSVDDSFVNEGDGVPQQIMKPNLVHCTSSVVTPVGDTSSVSLQSNGPAAVGSESTILQQASQAVFPTVVDHHVAPAITPTVPVTITRRLSLDDSSEEEPPVIVHVVNAAIIHDEPLLRNSPVVSPPTNGEARPRIRSPNGSVELERPLNDLDEIRIDRPGELLTPVRPVEVVPRPVDMEEQVAIIREEVELERRRRRLPTLLLATERALPENHPRSYLGPLDRRCNHCEALHFRGEMTTRGHFVTCCHNGRVALPDLQPMPDMLSALFRGEGPRTDHNIEMWKNFKDNILRYNYTFQFASMKFTIRDDLDPNVPCPSVFAIRDKIHHYISNVNHRAQQPRFGPIYYLSTERAIDVRIRNNLHAGLKENLIREIEILLRGINPYARAYLHLYQRYERELTNYENRMALPNHERVRMPEVFLDLVATRGPDHRRYDLPVVDEVAAVYSSEDDNAPPRPDIRIYVRDPNIRPPNNDNNNEPNNHPNVGPNIEPGPQPNVEVNDEPNAGVNGQIVRRNNDRFMTLFHTNDAVQPLTFPLLFPRGDRGWREGIPHTDRPDKSVSLCEYYAYRLAFRQRETRFQYAHKLAQQYIVNAYIDIESSRLSYIRERQDDLRAEQYEGLADYLRRRVEQNDNAARLGKMIILPSSFIGSPRAQHQNFQDAMAVVCKYGHPSLFITMTTNPKWPEIVENIPRGHQSVNHPMLVSRVFKCKMDLFMGDILEASIFGEHISLLSVTEFQKRGLPHSHTLVILKDQDRIVDPQQIDRLICAEIPDAATEPNLYEIVSRNMVHHPCHEDENAACLVKGVCSKGFPKPFSDATIIQENGRVVYRRRNDGRTITTTYKGRQYELDNRSIVAYNPYCLLKYNCHMNVDACTTNNSVKYLYKYFFKGVDMALVRMTVNGQVAQFQYDEIESFLSARYMAPPEASWHILQYPMMKNTHTVCRLCVHLPHRNVVRFRPGDEMGALERNEITQLTGWFLLNQADENARQYLYTEIPLHYRWMSQERYWKRRVRGGEKIITRIYAITMRNQELYCLRTLLLHRRGATSFEDLRTVDGHLCDTFLEACQLLNLMADDIEWRRALREACHRDMPYQLRSMFSYMLIFCDISDKLALWEEFRPYFIEDFTRQGIDDDVATQRCLAHIQSILMMHGTRLSNLGLPEPRIVDVDNDVAVDPRAMRLEAARLRNQLNPEQNGIFRAVYEAVHDDEQRRRLFFVNAAAGAGKSFLFQTLISMFQGEEIATVVCAPTGIAAMLLSGGRTLHSRFRLPLEIDETTTAGVTPNSEAGRFLKSAKLLLIDEISMVTKSVFKIVERAMRDLCDNDRRPFANKVVVVGGDFRQTLPIILGGFREHIVHECVRDTLDNFNFHKCDLLTNMRAQNDDDHFSEWLLQLGNDTLPAFRATNYGNLIELPSQCVSDSKEQLIDFCLGDLSFEFVSKNAILTPFNAACYTINDDILNRLPGVVKTYLSCDSVEEEDRPDVQYADYSAEYLNSLQLGGFPPHRLQLKVGCIVVLLRNLDLKRGLCNGTRLLIRVLGNRYLDGEKLDQTGNLTGERIFIPRVDLISTNTTLPFKMRRRQFPIRLAYAMTINKSQGQTFDRVGIVLPSPCFGHGQLYVAFSRARGFDKLRVFVEQSSLQGNLNRHNVEATYTRNIVYREVL